MKEVALKRNGQEVIAKCAIATTFFTRLKGLLGRTSLTENEALFFPECNSIHTVFMKIPIDVLFLSVEGQVVDILPNLKPWKMPLPRFNAKHVVEMKAHLASKLGFKVGDQIHVAGVCGGDVNET